MSYFVPQGGVLEDIGSAIKTGAQATLNIYGQTQKQAGIIEGMSAGQQPAVAQADTGMPGWVWPVAIGGGVLLLVLVMRKKR